MNEIKQPIALLAWPTQPMNERCQVQEIGNPSNVSMVGMREHCDEYCARANDIMLQAGENTRFEVAPEVKS